jgi:phage replication initiation protein
VCPCISHLVDEADWKEFVIGLLRSYVDFRQISKDAEDEERYWAPVLEWYALLTEGFQKGRLAQENAGADPAKCETMGE